MPCTKAQLLALLSMIEKKIALKCKDVECALDIISQVKYHIEELAEGEILKELGLAL